MFAHRLRTLYVLLAAVLVLEAGRLFQLQALSVNRDPLGRTSSRLYRDETIEPARGAICDRNGNELAADKPRLDLFIAYYMLSKPDEWLTQVSAVTGIATQDLLARAHAIQEAVRRIKAAVSPRYPQIREEKIAHALVPNVSVEVAARVEVQPELYPGISVRLTHSRVYPGGSLACHALGFIGRLRTGETPPKADVPGSLMKAYLPGDVVGKTGLERQYDACLQGAPGHRLFGRDTKSGANNLVIDAPAVAGGTLWLTLDSRAQQAAERALVGKIGAIVFMDVETGGVLVMASSPGYDLNSIQRDLPALAVDEVRKPMLNRAIQDPVLLASVMKIADAVAALEDGALTENTVLSCKGFLRIGKRDFTCPGRYAHGNLTIRQALQHSCNVFFYQLGLHEGVDRLVLWARALGLGARTGVDLPGEWPGRIADRQWMAANLHRPWYDGDTANLAIGHGDMQVTPLQAAVMTAAVANGGKILRPSLMMKITDDNGDVVRGAGRDNVIRTVRISERTLRAVREGMGMVVRSGTARHVAGLREARAAVKTGTGEAPHNLYYAWVAGFAPSDRPRVSFAAVIHGTPQTGAAAAAPMVAATLKALFASDSKN